MLAKKSRRKTKAETAAEGLVRRQPDAVTEAMNTVCATVGDQADEFVRAAARCTLLKSKL